jgi:cytochrome P450 family 135
MLLLPTRHHPVIAQTFYCRVTPSTYLEQRRRRLGERFRISALGMPPLAFLAAADDINLALVGDRPTLDAGAGSTMIAPIVGQCSFMLRDDADHAWIRSTLAPAFRTDATMRHADLVCGKALRDIQNWPSDRIVMLEPRLRSLTLRILLRVLIGPASDLTASLHSALIRMLAVTTTLVLMVPQTRHLVGARARWQAFQRDLSAVDALIYALIRERRVNGAAGEQYVLDLLLSAERSDGSKLSDREVRDNLISLIVAGHETTTGQLSWAFQLLAHQQAAQAQLASELAADNSDDHLVAMINETMRLKPAFLFAMPRKVVTPLELAGEIYYPPTHLVPCTYLLHHDPALYRDPHEFRLDRFLDEPARPRAWLPWGGGRKYCLGRHFALMEMKTILRHALANWLVLPASGRIERPRWRTAIVVPYAGCRVMLKARHTRSSAQTCSCSNRSL